MLEGASHPRSTTRRLLLALCLTVLYTAAEFVGGLLSGSLALLADAGHMLTDDLALGLALAAAWFARRPPDRGRTYGYQRAEILGALANGTLLVLLCFGIVWEAARRLRNPPEVEVEIMAAVASGGLAVNLIAAWLLRGRGHGLNVRGAYLHVLGDLLGSIGTLGAAGLIALAGWRWADPAASVLIAGIILFNSVRLVLDSVHVLMEGTPPGVDPWEVREKLRALGGVADVHDLHLWTLGSGRPLLTAHLVADHTVPAARILRAATEMLAARFGITHATLQVEPPDFNIAEELSEAAFRTKGADPAKRPVDRKDGSP